MSCTLACFEAFSAQTGGNWTQRDIILTFPHLCQGNQPVPGYVQTADYATLANVLGFHCEPIDPHPLPLPHHPTRAILIGAGNFNGAQHSLLWIRALPGDRGLALDPNPNVIRPMRFNLGDLNHWICQFWMLRRAAPGAISLLAHPST